MDGGECRVAYLQEQTRSESLAISSGGADHGCAPLQSYTPSERQVCVLPSLISVCLYKLDNTYAEDFVHKCINVMV